MRRALFDPDSLLTKIGNRAPGGAIGASASPIDWVTSSSGRGSSPDFSDPDRAVRSESKNDLVLIEGARGGHRAEAADPPPPPPGPGLALRPPSGESFEARLLARSRWPDSKRVEDRRRPDPRATMTVEEWVDNHSEWRKPGR